MPRQKLTLNLEAKRISGTDMKLPDRPEAENIEEWAIGYEDAYHDTVWPDSDTTNAKQLLAEYRKQAQFIAECITKVYDDTHH